jgi:hypothetical protein
MVGLVCLSVCLCVYVLVWCCTFSSLWLFGSGLATHPYILIGRFVSFFPVSFLVGMDLFWLDHWVSGLLLISSCVDRSSSEVDEGYVGYFDMRDMGF